MARMIRHEQTGPYKLEPQDKPVWICMCGLSQDLPFCDKSHAKCKAEVPGTLHFYDPGRSRITSLTQDNA